MALGLQRKVRAHLQRADFPGEVVFVVVAELVHRREVHRRRIHRGGIQEHHAPHLSPDRNRVALDIFGTEDHGLCGDTERDGGAATQNALLRNPPITQPQGLEANLPRTPARQTVLEAVQRIAILRPKLTEEIHAPVQVRLAVNLRPEHVGRDRHHQRPVLVGVRHLAVFGPGGGLASTHVRRVEPVRVLREGKRREVPEEHLLPMLRKVLLRVGRHKGVPIEHHEVVWDAVDRLPGRLLEIGTLRVLEQALAAAPLDHAPRPPLLAARVPGLVAVDELVSPDHVANPARAKKVVHLVQVSREDVVPRALPALRADAVEVVLVVARTDPLRLEDLDHLLHHVEQQLVAPRIRRAERVGVLVVLPLGDLGVRHAEPERVSRRLHLGDDLDVVLSGAAQDPAEVVVAEPCPPAQLGMEGVFPPRVEGVVVDQRHLRERELARLVGERLPNPVDLGMASELHPRADLKDDRVDLAGGHVPDQALEVFDLLLGRDVEVDAAEGMKGPVHAPGAGDTEFFTAPLDHLEKGLRGVEEPGGSPGGHHHAIPGDRKGVPLGAERRGIHAQTSRLQRANDHRVVEGPQEDAPLPRPVRPVKLESDSVGLAEAIAQVAGHLERVGGEQVRALEARLVSEREGPAGLSDRMRLGNKDHLRCGSWGRKRSAVPKQRISSSTAMPMSRTSWKV